MNIGIWGDSIVWGASDTSGGGWAERLRIHLMDSSLGEIETYVLGIPGDTTTGLLKRFGGEALARNPDLIIFGIGTNDTVTYKNRDNYSETDPDLFKHNISLLTSAARAFTDKIVWLGLNSVLEEKTNPLPDSKKGASYTNSKITEYDALIKEMALAEKVYFLPTLGIVGEADLKGDGLHPDSHGHKKLYEHIKDYLVSEKLIV